VSGVILAIAAAFGPRRKGTRRVGFSV
jgi:hypothetical protein